MYTVTGIGERSLFPEVAPEPKEKKKRYSWEIKFLGKTFVVEGNTKREAFAEVARAAMEMIGYSNESCCRKALKNGAKVLSKNALQKYRAFILFRTPCFFFP